MTHLIAATLWLCLTVTPPSGIAVIAKQMGFVNVRELDPDLMVDLKYSSNDNFMKMDVYGDLKECYLERSVAERLKRAHTSLRQIDSRYRFLIFDGLRPVSVQWIMWKLVKGTPDQAYVANPASGTIHNYGADVDLTVALLLTDGTVVHLNMGTPYDASIEEAQPRLEPALLKAGRLTQEQVSNRQLLRRAMNAGGFKVLPIEWWHFNAFSLAEAKRRIKPLQ
ncbi:MAG: M15 family metallopeptidase [bacterium]